MSDECQATNADVVRDELGPAHQPGPGKRPRIGGGGLKDRFGHPIKRLVRDNPALLLKAATLRGAGYTVEAIAKELGIAYVTAQKMLKESGIDDTLKRASVTVKNAIPQIAKMTTREILDKKDRRLGLEVLKETGVLAEVNPRKEQPDAGRITFEFNFPPPPWAPRAIVDAPPKAELHDSVQDAEIVLPDTNEVIGESKAELHTEPAPVDVPPRD